MHARQLKLAFTTTVVALGTILLGGCTGFCQDINCATPFHWFGGPTGEEVLPPGEYKTTLRIEDFDPIEIICTHSPIPEDNSCREAGEPNDDLEVAVNVHDDGIEVEIRVEAQSEESCQGPTAVRIEVEVDGTSRLVEQYDDIEYERTESNNGCGFQDSPQSFESELVLPP